MMRSFKKFTPASARLFSDSQEKPPAGVYIANIDGAARGNPGPASYAVVMRDPAGQLVLELAKRLGRETNNVAEYYALIAALDFATNHGITALRIRSDSELLVRQMQGRYKVKSADLKPLHERASKLSRQIAYFAIEHVRREMNRDADVLANVALDSGNVQTSTHDSRGSTSLASMPAASKDSAGKAARGRGTTRQEIRARFLRGVLVPSEPLNLPEGTEVSLELRTEEKESS
jgi:ribonuclease HI